MCAEANFALHRLYVVTRDVRNVGKEHGVEDLCEASVSSTLRRAYRHTKLHYRIRAVEAGHMSFTWSRLEGYLS
jgi:hypothetical protein